MKTAEAFALITRIENQLDTSKFMFKGINTWPLVRHILWFKLISQEVKDQKDFSDYKRIWRSRLGTLAAYLHYFFSRKSDKNGAQVLFFSRPAYLQELDEEILFDRVVDPIIDSLDGSTKFKKYYVANVSSPQKLAFEHSLIFQSYFSLAGQLTTEHKRALVEVADISTISLAFLTNSYEKKLKTFSRWYVAAYKELKKYHNARRIYLTSWYFPDMMGVCAAAKSLKIETVEVQHGKQGKFQAMYSGWSKIPKNGFEMMPDKFWCWGHPSCEHILEASPDRKHHTPFVGGYPWIDYYRRNKSETFDSPYLNSRVVLVTMQAPQGSNRERIPDFIINFILCNLQSDTLFIFRAHPNDSAGLAYCAKRVEVLPPGTYLIEPGKENLYDLFQVATHHITAYSSCCYEALVFNVPTLLYGEEASTIYEEEIAKGVFTWNDSNAEGLAAWLSSADTKSIDASDKYIEN